MRYLITGANGFIGRKLVESLSNSSDNEVFVLDLAFDQIAKSQNIHHLNMDLLNIDKSKLPQVDCLIHTAALLGVDFVEQNPSETLMNNIRMLEPLLGYIKSEKGKFVFFSTSEVYGDGLKKSQSGDDEFLSNDPSKNIGLPEIDDPRTSYPLSKIVGEFLTRLSNNFLILRPHNIYGPNMGIKHVIPQLIKKIDKVSDGDKVDLFNPEHQRSFCFINDAVSQILYLLDNDKQGVFNIGNPEEPIKISSLFDMIAFKMKKNISFKEVKQHKTSPAYRKPIIDDGFSNFTKLSRGLDEMINFYSKIDDL